MKITDALLGEHAVLYDLFGHLRNTAVTSDDIAEIRAAVAVVAKLLLAHARVEEDLLFPRLDAHLGQMGPLAVMRSEHQGIDDLLEAARGETDLASLKSLVGRLLALASGHFRKEETVLFGMAQQFLGDAVLSELGEEWAAARNVTLGGGGCMAAG
ncbi:MAG: hemerythrin domain-containing protein [Proteobacteria bacterium]|nr:hemerythrin domain-containing protein [Pseudomonadota bacterium]